MLVTLYTSRIVLEELGVVDFGVYNVVAGVVAMLGFLRSSMSLSVQRFFSYEIGTGNKDKLNILFNVSLFAHIILMILVLIIAETLGLWFVQTQLKIPSDRFNSALFVYHCVVISCSFSILSVPFNAMLISSERFSVYAYVSIIEVLLKLLVSFLLIMDMYDKLKFYGFLTMFVTVVITIIYIVYVRTHFKETKLKKVWDRQILNNILSFSWWSMLGELAWVFVNQGINMLINIFNGPVVNAARAISYQVNGAVTSLTRSFQQAVNPQLIKRYALNDIKGMENLLFRSTRFSYYLMLFMTLPLLFEMPIVLDIWLKEVPKHAILFCRLILIGGMIDGLSNLLATIAKAYGKIRNYQMIVSLILMINFPLSYILLKMGYFPEVTLVVYMAVSVCLLIIRLYFAKKMVGISPMSYFREVIWPIMKVTLIASTFLYVIFDKFKFSLEGFFFFCLMSVIIVGLSIYTIGLKYKEREQLKEFLKQKLIINKNNG